MRGLSASAFVRDSWVIFLPLEFKPCLSTSDLPGQWHRCRVPFFFVCVGMFKISNALMIKGSFLLFGNFVPIHLCILITPAMEVLHWARQGPLPPLCCSAGRRRIGVTKRRI